MFDPLTRIVDLARSSLIWNFYIETRVSARVLSIPTRAFHREGLEKYSLADVTDPWDRIREELRNRISGCLLRQSVKRIVYIEEPRRVFFSRNCFWSCRKGLILRSSRLILLQRSRWNRKINGSRPSNRIKWMVYKIPIAIYFLPRPCGN